MQIRRAAHAQQAQRRADAALPAVIFLLGLVLTLLGAELVSDREETRRDEAFSRDARTLSEAVEARTRVFTLKLQDLAAFMSSDEEAVPGQDSWNRFLNKAEIDTLEELPLLAFVEPVQGRDVEAFLADGRFTNPVDRDPNEFHLFATHISRNGTSLLSGASLADRTFTLDVSDLDVASVLLDDSRTAEEPRFFVLQSDFFQGLEVNSLLGSFSQGVEPGDAVAFSLPTFDPADGSLRGWVVGVADPAAILDEEASGKPFAIEMQLLADSGDSTTLAKYVPAGLQPEDVEFAFTSEADLVGNRWQFQTLAGSSFDNGDGVAPVALIVGLGSTIMLTLGATLRWRAARRTSAMRQLVDRTEVRARTDELTGLTNRTGLMEALGTAIDNAGPDRPTAVLFMDLNRFKNINDTLGHSAGDDLLRGVAGLLAGQVQPGETLARFGGDEFVLVAPTMRPGCDPTVIAERMLAPLDDMIELASGTMRASMAVGIACTDSARKHTPEALLRDADLAMYRAKRRGQSVDIFDDSMREDAVSRLAIERQLQAGFQDLVVLFQPIVSVSDGRVRTVEALVRWNRPGVGLVAPSDFLDVALEAGLLDGLGLHVLAQATAEVAARNRANPGVPTELAVNVVLSQLRDPGFLQQVVAILDQSGLAPELLTLELSEDIALEHLDDVVSILYPLSQLGIQLSIDDFGSGNTSFAHLSRLDHVSELKIDGSFITDLTSDSSAEALVRGMMTIAQQLDLRVVAEGVETTEIYRACAALGIDCIQGFLFGRASPLAEIPATIPLPSKPAAVPPDRSAVRVA